MKKYLFWFIEYFVYGNSILKGLTLWPVIFRLPYLCTPKLFFYEAWFIFLELLATFQTLLLIYIYVVYKLDGERLRTSINPFLKILISLLAIAWQRISGSLLLADTNTEFSAGSLYFFPKYLFWQTVSFREWI